MSAKTITRLISRVKRGFNIYLLSLIIRFSRHAMWQVQHTVAVIWIPVGVVVEFPLEQQLLSLADVELLLEQ